MAIDYNGLIKKVCEQTLNLALYYNDEDIENRNTIRWARWDWSIGVAFYGVWQAYEYLQEEEFVQKMKTWLDARLEHRIDSININTAAPMFSIFNIYQKFGDKKYEQIIRFFDSYLVYFGLRTPCGALSHTVIGKHRPEEVWADTLFMAGIYMAKRGVYLKNDYYIQEVIKQLVLHGACLLDKETDLFYHGWHDQRKEFLGVRWGRGNAWVTASIVDILEVLDRDFPEKEQTLELLRNQVAALSKVQRPDGLWSTVLDHDDTYPEVSVTAGVAYGILKGIRLGYIDEKYKIMAQKAVEGVASHIDEKGNVLLASGGTPVFSSVAEYNIVPYEITPFNQGLVLMALCEAACDQ